MGVALRYGSHLLADVLHGVREEAENLVLLGVGALASGVNPSSATGAFCERRKAMISKGSC